MTQVGDIWYRYEDYRTAHSCDEFGNSQGGSDPALRLRQMKVTRVTPKGVWLSDRFVLADAHKRFACPTIEEARESFLKRKARETSIHQAKINHIKEVLELLNKEKYDARSF